MWEWSPRIPTAMPKRQVLLFARNSFAGMGVAFLFCFKIFPSHFSFTQGVVDGRKHRRPDSCAKPTVSCCLVHLDPFKYVQVKCYAMRINLNVSVMTVTTLHSIQHGVVHPVCVSAILARYLFSGNSASFEEDKLTALSIVWRERASSYVAGMICSQNSCNE